METAGFIESTAGNKSSPACGICSCNERGLGQGLFRPVWVCNTQLQRENFLGTGSAHLYNLLFLSIFLFNDALASI